MAWEEQLRSARARRNLAERALREAVNAAVVPDGIAAADVARALRISRSDAERLLGALEHAREPDGRLPRTPTASPSATPSVSSRASRCGRRWAPGTTRRGA